MQREMFWDKKFTAKLEAAAEAPEPGGDPGGDLGGGLDLGGGEDDDAGGDLGDLDLGGDDEPAADEGGGDDVLLAEPDAPAKRDDEKYKRGPYKRHRSSYDKGGRRKHFKNQATGEYGNTKRSVWKGKTGFGGLDSLARGITESKTYNNIEEEKLFNTSNDIDSLLESLNKMEKKQNEDETQ
jgi:hypothetical protein